MPPPLTPQFIHPPTGDRLSLADFIDQRPKGFCFLTGCHLTLRIFLHLLLEKKKAAGFLQRLKQMFPNN